VANSSIAREDATTARVTESGVPGADFLGRGTRLLLEKMDNAGAPDEPVSPAVVSRTAAWPRHTSRIKADSPARLRCAS
jgi:hypothetical protein